MWATGLAPESDPDAGIESTYEYTEVAMYEEAGDGGEEMTSGEMSDAVPDIEGATYLGCYEDMRYERTMDFAYVNDDDLTNGVS